VKVSGERTGKPAVLLASKLNILPKICTLAHLTLEREEAVGVQSEGDLVLFAPGRPLCSEGILLPMLKNLFLGNQNHAPAKVCMSNNMH